jgi:hypothetical protein
LIFGSIASPYVYIALGALANLPLTSILIVVPWLMSCTSLLLLILISRSRLEAKLAHNIGPYFQPAIVAAVIVAMGNSYFIESKIANFTLLLPIEYWYYMIVVSGIATAAALVVIIAAPSSRLEKFIASKLSRGNKLFILYRTVGYLTLMIGLLFVFSRLYQHWLYKRPPSP